jgi:hypothetical protein
MPQEWFAFTESKFSVKGISFELDKFETEVNSQPKDSLHQEMRCLGRPLMWPLGL